jgi:hypothetical protein
VAVAPTTKGNRGDVVSMIQPISSAPTGVLPNHAIWCRAMTRPCIDGSVACCTATVSIDWKAADTKPSGMLTSTNTA